MVFFYTTNAGTKSPLLISFSHTPRRRSAGLAGHYSIKPSTRPMLPTLTPRATPNSSFPFAHEGPRSSIFLISNEELNFQQEKKKDMRVVDQIVIARVNSVVLLPSFRCDMTTCDVIGPKLVSQKMILACMIDYARNEKWCYLGFAVLGRHITDALVSDRGNADNIRE